MIARASLLLLCWAPAAIPADWAADAEQLPEAALLSIGVQEMSAPAPGSAPHSAEAVYVPYVLRRVLERTERWGPVRMLTGPDHPVELLVGGTIVASDGITLRVHVVATDAAGRRWIDREYRAAARLDDYLDSDRSEPFESLYQEIAADLDQYRSKLSLEQLRHLIELARLRYAAALAPDAFSDHLQRESDGRYRIRRLPAEDDPILARIERIREAEHLFVDTVDLKFGRYFETLSPTYTAWRRTNVEAQALMASYRDGAEARRGRKSARQRYYELRELKLHQQTLREALAAFAFEVGPTTLELDGELVELSGTLEAQSQQWRALLQRIYAAEVGLPR